MCASNPADTHKAKTRLPRLKTLKFSATPPLWNLQEEVPFLSRLSLQYPLPPAEGSLSRARPCRPEDERKHFRDVRLPHHSHPPVNRNIRSIQLMIAPPFLCISQLSAGIWSQILVYIYIFFLSGSRVLPVWTCRREGSQSRSNSTPSPMETLLTVPEPRSKWHLSSSDFNIGRYLQRKMNHYIVWPVGKLVFT